MRKLLYILAAILLVGCEDTFTGPSQGPIATDSHIIFTTIDLSMPAYWQFSGIAVRDIASGVTRTVIEKPSYLFCAPRAGRLLYGEYDETYFSVIMKLARTDGTDIKVIDTFSIGDMIERAVLSPDGKKVAAVVYYDDYINQTMGYYIKFYDIESETSQIIDQNALPMGSGLSPVLVTHISFSPDGRYLAAAKWDSFSHIQLYTGSNGTPDRVLTVNVGPYFNWSASGREIVYIENPQLFVVRDGSGNIFMDSSTPSILHISNVDNGISIASVHDLPPEIWDVALSTDGRKVAIGQYRENAVKLYTTDIVTFPLSSPLNRDTLSLKTGEGHRGRLQWSRDDNQLLYTLSSNPSDELLYGEVARYTNMRGTGHSDNVEQTFAFDGYWFTN